MRLRASLRGAGTGAAALAPFALRRFLFIVHPFLPSACTFAVLAWRRVLFAVEACCLRGEEGLGGLGMGSVAGWEEGG